MRSESGAATVEHAAISLLIALLIAATVAAVASGTRDGGRELGYALARKLRCAAVGPGPCWRDPLTLAYGRPLAGAVRALAPAPAARSGLLPVDFRFCRSASCAALGPDPGHTASNRRVTALAAVDDRHPAAGSGLLPVAFGSCRWASCGARGPAPGHPASNGRVTAFVAIEDRRRSAGLAEIAYWLYRPTLGWERVVRSATSADVARLAATPLLDDAVPVLVPLETLDGRDQYDWPPGEEPPWRWRVESVYP